MKHYFANKTLEDIVTHFIRKREKPNDEQKARLVENITTHLLTPVRPPARATPAHARFRT